MRHAVIWFFVVLAFPNLLVSQGQVSIEIIQSQYEVGESSLYITIQIHNPTADTLVLFRPTSTQFANHFTMQMTSLIHNQLGSAYNLVISQEGACEEQEEYLRPFGQQPNFRYASEYDILSVPPQQTSEQIEIWVELVDTWFCGEATYFCMLEYQPKVALLTAKQEKELIKQAQALNKSIDAVNAYLESEKLSRDRMQTQGMLPDRILAGNQILNKITPLTIRSEKVRLMKN